MSLIGSLSGTISGLQELARWQRDRSKAKLISEMTAILMNLEMLKYEADVLSLRIDENVTNGEKLIRSDTATTCGST